MELRIPERKHGMVESEFGGGGGRRGGEGGVDSIHRMLMGEEK